MKILGMQVPFTSTGRKSGALSTVNEGRGWRRISESFGGAWQKNVTVDRSIVVSQPSVYACKTLIAQDIAKLRIKLVQQTAEGVWVEVKNSAYSPVLRKPNAFQNRMQFVETWILSKLSYGNTYVLKQRDGRGVVVALYVLDPQRVTPMVASDGSVFYKLAADNLASLPEAILVPAREIIHDRFNCLFHPLVGTSPLMACGLAAMAAYNIQQASAIFFGNQSRPGGILTAPGEISEDTADRLKATWVENFSGSNAGKIAVLGDGLTYERMAMTAEESQLVEQSKWKSEEICSTYHVPPYKIGVGAIPSYDNIQSLNVEYYSQCLQSLIEAMELCLDEGLATGETLGTELDVDNLLRMDSASLMRMLKEGDGVLTPNEQRLALNKPSVAGGNSVYKQQQDFSLEALAKRDARDDPFATTPKPESSGPASAPTSAAKLTTLKVRKLFTLKEAA